MKFYQASASGSILAFQAEFCNDMTVKIQGKQVQGSVYQLSNLFDAVDLLSYRYPLRARQIFVSKSENRLNVAIAMTCALFKRIYQKLARAKCV